MYVRVVREMRLIICGGDNYLQCLVRSVASVDDDREIFFKSFHVFEKNSSKLAYILRLNAELIGGFSLSCLR